MFRALRRTTGGALAGVGLLAALTLAGCGGDPPAAGPTTGVGAPSDPATSAPAAGDTAAAAPATTKPATPHNATDIAFASGMIPHNVQVLASTQIAGSRAVKPQVKTLATKLSTTQVPQIEAMSAWLANWGQPVPAGGTAATGSAGITQADLVKLSQAAPAGFDKLWLTTMIKHQQNAVNLAKTEVKSGTSAEAKALAKKIITEQQAQITAMKGLLKTA
jgi:uncharacterized protein (DUF305 family)